jgi:hypothetical protein
MLTLCLALLFFAPEDLPKGEDILARYVAVTGGRAAYEKVHGSIAKGTMSLTAQNLKGSMTVYESEPMKQVTVVEFPGIGRMEEGTDGSIAWSTSAMEGARLKQGEEKAMALRAANSEAKFLDWKRLFKSVETVGVEDVDGKPCYKVLFTPLVGKPETEYYEKVSGLLVKELATVTMPMGEVPVSMTIGGYRNEGGILMPHSLQQNLAGQKIDITIESVVINPEFPPKRFDPPADVRALVK